MYRGTKVVWENLALIELVMQLKALQNFMIMFKQNLSLCALLREIHKQPMLIEKLAFM